MTATDYEALLSRHDYAIIDRAALADESEIDGLPIEPLVPYEMRLRGDTDIAPALLPLEAGAPYMKTLADAFEAADAGLGRYPFTCLFEAPGVKHARMKAHLTYRLILHSPRGGKDRLRYHDPRVFPQLVRILTPEQLRALYGPIQVWTFPFQQQWQSQPAPEVTGIVPAYWSVKTEQREQLDRVFPLNAVLDAHAKRLGRPWADLAEYSAVSQTADEALETARVRYRLTDADSLTFALHALAHGEHFHCHPRIQTLLRVAWENKEMPYAATAAMIDARTWEIIAAESLTIQWNKRSLP